MTLGQKQRLFTLLTSKLIQYAYEQGYELTYGDAYRDPALAKLNAAKGTGIANSLHTQRLAVDFNLFKDGVYLTRSEDHAPLGKYWKSLHPLCRWGGDFRPNPDGNHYSIEHNGVK
jgi:hypothetical protein